MLPLSIQRKCQGVEVHGFLVRGLDAFKQHINIGIVDRTVSINMSSKELDCDYGDIASYVPDEEQIEP